MTGIGWRLCGIVAGAVALALATPLQGCGHPSVAAAPPGAPPPAQSAPAKRIADEASTLVWGADARGLGSIAVSDGRLFVGFERGVSVFSGGVAGRQVAWPRHDVEVDTGRIAALGGRVYFYLDQGQHRDIQRLDVDSGAPATKFLGLHDEMGDIAVDRNALVVTTREAVTVAPLPEGPAWTATFPGDYTHGLAIDARYAYVSVGHALWRVDRRDRTQTELAVAGEHRSIHAVVSDGTNVYFFISNNLFSGRGEGGAPKTTLVMRVPATGGSATQVAELPKGVASAAIANGILFAEQEDSVVAVDVATGHVETVDIGWAYPRRLLVDGDFLSYVSKSGVRRVSITRRLPEARLRLPSCTPVAEAPPPKPPAITLGTAARGDVGTVRSDATGVYWSEPKAGRIMRVARPGADGAPRAAQAAVVAEHQVEPSALAVGGGRAYWIAGKHDITRAGVGGSGPEVIWRTKLEAHGLALLGDVVYWVEKTPEYDDVLMELRSPGGPPRDVLHLSLVLDLVSGGDSVFLGLQQGGVVRFDAASGRARILAGTDSAAHLSVAGSFVYWASPRETAAYRVDRDGGVPQQLLLSPRGSHRDVVITAISISGTRAIWMARDDFNEARIAEGDLSGGCARIGWTTVDSAATSVYADEAGVYWAARDHVLAKPAIAK